MRHQMFFITCMTTTDAAANAIANTANLNSLCIFSRSISDPSQSPSMPSMMPNIQANPSTWGMSVSLVPCTPKKIHPPIDSAAPSTHIATRARMSSNRSWL